MFWKSVAKYPEVPKHQSMHFLGAGSKKINQPCFKYATLFTENLVAIHSHKNKLFFNKPLFIGFAVLDYSKFLMYDFYYNVVKPYFQRDVTLLYTDTDSFLLEIKNKSVEDFILSHADYFDTSDYQKNHRCYNSNNRKVIGKMKDELQSEKMKMFIGLGSKMYAYITEKELVKRLKGTTRSVLEKTISFDNYYNCLMYHVDCFREQHVIRARNHDLGTETVLKKALTWFDDKRFLIPNSVETLAHGHYRIAEYADQSWHPPNP